MRIWFKSCRVELDAVIVLSGEMSLSHMSPCVASHDVGIGNLSFFFSLYFSLSSLSLSLSFSISFYAHSLVALVNIFFALALVKRNESLYTWCAARDEEHAWSRTVTHGLSRVHAGQYTCHTSRRIPCVTTGGTRKKEVSLFLPSRLISVSAKLC